MCQVAVAYFMVAGPTGASQARTQQTNKVKKRYTCASRAVFIQQETHTAQHQAASSHVPFCEDPAAEHHSIHMPLETVLRMLRKLEEPDLTPGR
jgi:hypothetical protein